MSATYAQFISDADRHEIYTVEIDGYQLSDGSIDTFYFSTDDYATENGESPSEQLFDARMVSGYSRQSGLSGGQTSARHMSGFIPRSTEGVVTLVQSFGDLDLGTADCLNGVPLRSYSFGGRRVLIKHGGWCKYGHVPYASFKVVEEGVLNGEPRIYPDRVEFIVKGPDGRFDVPIQDRRFWGTNTCAFFDGVSAYINCGTSNDFNLTTQDATIAFNIFIESYPAADRTLITRGTAAVAGWDVKIDSSGRPKMNTYQSGATQTTLATPLALGRWQQVVFVRSGAAIAVYIDAVGAPHTLGTHTNPATNSGATMYMGTPTAISNFFEGALDDVRIVIGTAITESQIEEQYGRPLESSEYSNWDLYYKFDDGAGALTADNLGSSGSGSDGDLDVGATDVLIVPSCMGLSDLEGRRMPDVWGEVHGWSPVQVDFANQIYMLHSSNIEAVDEVMLGGYKDAYIAGTNYASWLQFVTTTTTPGEYDLCIAGGWSFIRLGGQPNYKLTVDIRGDKEGGTYRETLSTIMRYIVCNRGQDPLADPADIDDDAWDDLESGKPSTVGLAYFDDRTIKDVLDAFCRSYGLWTFFKRADGLFTVRQLDDPSSGTPVVDLTEHQVARGSLQVIDSGAPVWEVTVRYNECPTVMGDGDLYEGIPEDDANFYRRQWRKTAVPRPKVKTRYLDAVQYEVETRFISYDAARVEVVRQSRLLRTPDQAFSMFVPRQSEDLELLDVVSFDYHDLDEYNQEQSRFGTSDSAYFYITAIREDAKRGGYTLDIWRPGVV